MDKLAGMAMFAAILYIPLYQQLVRGYSPTKSGLLMLPLVLGLGAGGELHRPLAIAVVGGLAISTATTLFVVPALAAPKEK